MTPPLVLDIDGTLTTPDGTIDPRAFEVVRSWDAPVVLATGKAFPYPVALCHFMGIPERVVAENGGVVYADDTVTLTTDGTRPNEAASAFVERGGDLGWGEADTVNRWRETEVACHLDADETLLREVAAEYGLDVVDTGYAFHLKNPGVEKGRGVEAVAETLGVDPEAFVAVGDSENDASTFAVVGRSFAVANADATAKSAADVVTSASYMDGTLEALHSLS